MKNEQKMAIFQFYSIKLFEGNFFLVHTRIFFMILEHDYSDLILIKIRKILT